VALALNQVYRNDCVKGLAQIEPGAIDLAFADPPFNIGYEYDEYDDNRHEDEYVDWCTQWMQGVYDALKPNGAFWLAIGDEFAAELKVAAQREVGFHCRSWVIWYYTFGVNSQYGFSRSHTHLIYLVKDKTDFTFNANNPAIRIPSARQLVYGDSRANPKGRLPDNTWILRPQDAPGGFAANHATWYFARVAGTFKEREGFHGCQMPEQLLGRIIRSCSNPNETILDPFGGSGTTFAVAKKLGRRWIGFEMSKEYTQRIKERLDKANVGDELDGPEDPVSSAPATKSRKARKLRNSHGDAVFQEAVVEAYKKSADGRSVDQLLADPEANKAFIKTCKKQKIKGSAAVWNRTLVSVRKSGKLPKKASKKSKPVTMKQIDAFAAAAEIAMQQLRVEFDQTIDDIFCSPELAEVFDEVAAGYAPGFSPREYRWAALAVRKKAKTWKRLAMEQFEDWLVEPLPEAIPLSTAVEQECDTPGTYIVVGKHDRPLYIGQAYNLGGRITQVANAPSWRELEPVAIQLIPSDEPQFGLQSTLIQRLKPALNSQLLIPPKAASAEAEDAVLAGA